VKYDAVVVVRVKITCGNGALGAGVNDIYSGLAIVPTRLLFGKNFPIITTRRFF
jgi:hypothetical protein